MPGDVFDEGNCGFVTAVMVSEGWIDWGVIDSYGYGNWGMVREVKMARWGV